MKRLFLSLGLLLFLSLSGYSQEKGIAFFEGQWEELLKAAQKKGRPFFVDFYAVWCGPCRLLEKRTFRDPKVGEYVKKHFLAYRLDAERGEGPALARKYGIRAYPTIIFFDASGKVIGRHVGYVDANTFIKILRNYEAKANQQGNLHRGDDTEAHWNRALTNYNEQLAMHKKKPSPSAN